MLTLTSIGVIISAVLLKRSYDKKKEKRKQEQQEDYIEE